MKNNSEYDPDRELKERVVGCLGISIVVFVAFCLLCVTVNYCNKPKPKTVGNHWLNYDPERPLSDVKSYDYERQLIIYRDEVNPRPLNKFDWEQDSSLYKEPANYYEDYYEDIYEYLA